MKGIFSGSKKPSASEIFVDNRIETQHQEVTIESPIEVKTPEKTAPKRLSQDSKTSSSNSLRKSQVIDDV